MAIIFNQMALLVKPYSEGDGQIAGLVIAIIVIILGFVGFGIFEIYKLGISNRRRVEALETHKKIADLKQDAMKSDVFALGNKVSDQIEQRFKDIESQQKEDNKEMRRQISEIYQMIISKQGND